MFTSDSGTWHKDDSISLNCVTVGISREQFFEFQGFGGKDKSLTGFCICLNVMNVICEIYVVLVNSNYPSDVQSCEIDCVCKLKIRERDKICINSKFIRVLRLIGLIIIQRNEILILYLIWFIKFTWTSCFKLIITPATELLTSYVIWMLSNLQQIIWSLHFRRLRIVMHVMSRPWSSFSSVLVLVCSVSYWKSNISV